MNLVYDAIDASGRQINATIEAENARAAVDRLRRDGLFVTHIARAEPRDPARAPAARGVNVTARLPLKVLMLFTRQMAMLLRADSAVVPALAAIGRQMKRREHAAIVEQLKIDLEEGLTLTDSLKKFPQVFDSSYCAIVAAGEASANLGAMFDRLARIIAKRKAMRGKVIGALAYPTLLTFLCSIVVNVLMFFVVPRFGDMFTTLGAQLPASTAFLLTTSHRVRSYWPLLAIGAGGAIATVVLLLKTAAGRQWLSDVQILIPIVGRLRVRLIQGQVFRILGMLIESRVGVLDALDLARGVTRNSRFQRMFDAMEGAITSGNVMSHAMENSRLIAPAFCQAIRTGEESGRLGDSISYVADVLDEENTELVNAVTKLTEPLILMLMGVVVGGVAISLFMPLFDLTSAIK